MPDQWTETEDGAFANRRQFLRTTGLTAVGAWGAACSPAATPAAPATGSQAPAGASGAGKAAWEQEWDRLVTAAKQEGKISLLLQPGPAIREAADSFEKAFPGIVTEQQVFNTEALAIPKIQQERKGSVYSMDLALFTVPGFFTTLKPEGTFDPVRPEIFRPDVLDDKVWAGGFEAGFMDQEKQWYYISLASVTTQIWIDTNQVKESEITSFKDLLNPKWKGRLLFGDVRTGFMFTWLTGVREKYGDDAVKQLLVDQQPSFVRDSRQAAEHMIRGQAAIGTGFLPPVIQEFWDKGVGKNVKQVFVDELVYATSATVLWLFNKRTHPAAAKLFINWFLAKDGQALWSKATQYNSRRTDVAPFDVATVIDPKKQYFWAVQETNLGKMTATRQFMEKLVQ